MEGGLQKIGKEWFDSGWQVVVDKKGIVGIGSTIKMNTPPKMVKMIKSGIELGDVNDILFNKKNTKHGQGHFGLMTNNHITREHGYMDGLISALARFMTPEVF
jgi:non-canonical (house-cleaning) NTP pyrophosphatase